MSSAWIIRNTDGVITAITAYRPAGPSNGVYKGYTVTEMEWEAAHALVRREWFGEDVEP